MSDNSNNSAVAGAACLPRRSNIDGLATAAAFLITLVATLVRIEQPQPGAADTILNRLLAAMALLPWGWIIAVMWAHATLWFVLALFGWGFTQDDSADDTAGGGA